MLAAGIGGVTKRTFDVAGIRYVDGRAVAFGAVNKPHIVPHGSTAVRYDRQVLEVETDRLRRVLGKLGAVGEHHRDGLSDIAYHVIGEHRLGIGHDRRARPSERNLRNRPVEIARGDDGVHARHRPRRGGVDRAHPAMRHGAAHNGGMPLPRPYQVVDILAAPAQVPQILDAFDRAADEGVNAFHDDWKKIDLDLTCAQASCITLLTRLAGQMDLSLLVNSFFRPDLIIRFAPEIAKAMIVTVQLAALVVITGIILGLVLAVIRSFEFKPVNFFIVVAVDLLRALPPLVLILLLYSGLPSLGVFLSSFQVLWLALGAVLAAFAEEIFWAGILSVRKGQWEAARSTSLTFGQTLAYIVLPQAVRLAVAPLTNRTIAITKNTALGGVIGVPEILNVATTAQSFVGNSTPLMIGALAYVLLFIPVVIIGRWLETRFGWKRF